jgi:hypothetical protein
MGVPKIDNDHFQDITVSVATVDRYDAFNFGKDAIYQPPKAL